MKKILIIEDEIILSEVLEKKLKMAGYKAETAVNGEEGLAKIRAEKFDLVLLDILMPKMNGFELMRILKEEGILNKQPIMVISNSGAKIDLQKAFDMGAKDVIIKSDFDPNGVLDKMKKLLKGTNS